jgi:hypothetical protein
VLVTWLPIFHDITTVFKLGRVKTSIKIPIN